MAYCFETPVGLRRVFYSCTYTYMHVCYTIPFRTSASKQPTGPKPLCAHKCRACHWRWRCWSKSCAAPSAIVAHVPLHHYEWFDKLCDAVDVFVLIISTPALARRTPTYTQQTDTNHNPVTNHPSMSSRLQTTQIQQCEAHACRPYFQHKHAMANG